jgi:hypothetical protein
VLNDPNFNKFVNKSYNETELQEILEALAQLTKKNQITPGNLVNLLEEKNYAKPPVSVFEQLIQEYRLKEKLETEITKMLGSIMVIPELSELETAKDSSSLGNIQDKIEGNVKNLNKELDSILRTLEKLKKFYERDEYNDIDERMVTELEKIDNIKTEIRLIKRYSDNIEGLKAFPESIVELQKCLASGEDDKHYSNHNINIPDAITEEIQILLNEIIDSFKTNDSADEINTKDASSKLGKLYNKIVNELGNKSKYPKPNKEYGDSMIDYITNIQYTILDTYLPKIQEFKTELNKLLDLEETPTNPEETPTT